MASTNMFTPGNSTALAITATSSNIAIPTGSGTNLFVQNAGAAVAWFLVGLSTATATIATAAGTAASMPLISGQSVMLSIDTNVTHVAGISAATATMYITRGQGQSR